jgi:Lysozyme like domain/D-alanyl-D-alanine carboxypeptidase
MVVSADRRGWGSLKTGTNTNPGFYSTNITVLRVAGLSLPVHKEVAPLIKGAIEECVRLGYSFTGGIKDDWGYSDRDIHNRPGVKSNHAWGLAVDLDATKNGLGSTKTSFPKFVITTFARYGFAWGGDYKRRKDPMHFEFTGSLDQARALRARLNTQGAIVGPSLTESQYSYDGPILSDGFNYSNGNRLNVIDYYKAAIAAGWTGDNAIIATAIAMAESRGDYKATGDKNIQNGVWGPSVGAMQIRTYRKETGKGTSRDIRILYELIPNFKAGLQVFKDAGNSFTPWSTYTTKVDSSNPSTYRHWIPLARQASGENSLDDHGFETEDGYTVNIPLAYGDVDISVAKVQAALGLVATGKFDKQLYDTIKARLTDAGVTQYGIELNGQTAGFLNVKWTG